MSTYAVIGWPLGHSLSPAVHNASFGALRLPHRFEAVPVPPGELGRFMAALPSSAFAGLAVTIPHKTGVMEYCASRDEETEAIGAANTVCRMPGGGLRACNTDAAAAMRALRAAGADPAGKRIVVLGAGGAARAVCYRALRDGAAAVIIANRTVARAERLRDDLRSRLSPAGEVDAVPLEQEALAGALGGAQILINTTAVGMHPRAGEMPLPAACLRRGLAVMDIVYNPAETLLLAAARERGALPIPGTEMMVYQAAEQERLWLGMEAPVGVMRAALLSALGKAP